MGFPALPAFIPEQLPDHAGAIIYSTEKLHFSGNWIPEKLEEGAWWTSSRSCRPS